MTLTAAFLAAALLLQSQPADSGKSTLRARTFSVMQTPDGDLVTETSRIPYRPRASCFAWVLEMLPADGERIFSEVLQLPDAAPDWTSDEGLEVDVSADGRSGAIEHRLPAGESELSSSWCIAPGDPLGAYQVTVREGDRLLHRFDFQIVVDGDVDETI
ncbi:MAG: hypothetical protein ACXWUX_12635 [Allosphingosinicella sp.]